MKRLTTMNMHMNKRSRQMRFYGSVILAISLVAACTFGCFSERKAKAEDNVALVLDWNRFILKAEMHTEGYRSPVISRAYGYIGLAAFEAALPGLAGDFQSFSGRFPGLDLPAPPPPEHYNMMLAMNACYAAMMSKFFLSAPEPTRKEMSGIAESWDLLIEPGLDTSVLRHSRAYGRDVANAVYTWSATDSLGYRSNHHNYDRNYIPPVGEGKWVTSVDFPMPALLPYWGKVRPFVIKPEDYLARPLPDYSTETNQPYYVQSLELISLTKNLSAENKWIAEFWDDDHPGLTFSPAGHWLAITNQVIAKEHPSIEKTMETYLKVGFALADAMIACWYSKYTYNLERPESYIQNHIDPTWRPYAPSPSFPTYPSGHALMGAAVAEVLTPLFGAEYKLTDTSHEGLEEFSIKPRSFSSFDQMAKENALSRILLGVHWRMDAEEGLRLGQLIGREVSRIEIEKKLTE
jgi:hypothetical protein